MRDATALPRLANPSPLGLAAFALTTWLLSMINASWFTGDAMGIVLACALAYGGTAQAIAGIMELPRGNTFGATAFLSYGAFWWSFALFVLFLHDKVPPAFVGWYLFLWRLHLLYVAGYLSIAACPSGHFSGALGHVRSAGCGGMDWLKRPAHGRRVYGHGHCRAGFLPVGGRSDQRGLRPCRFAHR
jgi:hypothetical protein